MSKEIEAFEDIIDSIPSKIKDYKTFENDYNTVKQALEQKEQQARELEELKSKVKKILENTLVVDFSELKKLVGDDDE